MPNEKTLTKGDKKTEKEKGELKSHYLKRCIPMLMKEGKKQPQAIAECISMFKQKWKAKGEKVPDETSVEFQNALANFNFEDCLECVKREKEANGIFEIDIVNKIF